MQGSKQGSVEVLKGVGHQNCGPFLGSLNNIWAVLFLGGPPTVFEKNMFLAQASICRFCSCGIEALQGLGFATNPSMHAYASFPK